MSGGELFAAAVDGPPNKRSVASREIEMRILTGMHQIDAETAAGRLRVAGIEARVVRDNEALLGVAGSSSLGTFSVLVAESNEDAARQALRIHKRDKSTGKATEDGPFSAQAVLLIVIALAVGLVAVYTWSLVVRP